MGLKKGLEMCLHKYKSSSILQTSEMCQREKELTGV